MFRRKFLALCLRVSSSSTLKSEFLFENSFLREGTIKYWIFSRVARSSQKYLDGDIFKKQRAKERLCKTGACAAVAPSLSNRRRILGFFRFSDRTASYSAHSIMIQFYFVARDNTSSSNLASPAIQIYVYGLSGHEYRAWKCRANRSRGSR